MCGQRSAWLRQLTPLLHPVSYSYNPMFDSLGGRIIEFRVVLLGHAWLSLQVLVRTGIGLLSLELELGWVLSL